MTQPAPDLPQFGLLFDGGAFSGTAATSSTSILRHGGGGSADTGGALSAGRTGALSGGPKVLALGGLAPAFLVALVDALAATACGFGYAERFIGGP